jgi:hypothetical protein
MQRISIQHATCNMKRATRSVPHETCMQTCNYTCMGNMQDAPCSVKHTPACSMQQRGPVLRRITVKATAGKAVGSDEAGGSIGGLLFSASTPRGTLGTLSVLLLPAHGKGTLPTHKHQPNVGGAGPCHVTRRRGILEMYSRGTQRSRADLAAYAYSNRSCTWTSPRMCRIRVIVLVRPFLTAESGRDRMGRGSTELAADPSRLAHGNS